MISGLLAFSVIPSHLWMVLALIIVSSWTLVKDRHVVTSSMVMWWVAATAATAFSAQWKVIEDDYGTLITLHSHPYVIMLTLAYIVQLPSRVHASLLFVSLFVVDLGMAMQRFWNDGPYVMLWGIGGAGFGDALFLIPASAVVLSWYHKIRHSHFYQNRHPTHSQH